MEIDEHIGCAMSGLTADARTLVEHARVQTQVIALCFEGRVYIVCIWWHQPCIDHDLAVQNHRFSYNEPMSVESTTQALCDLALRFGEGDEESMVIANWSFCFFEIHETVVLMLDKWSSLMFRYSWIVSQYLYRYVMLWMCIYLRLCCCLFYCSHVLLESLCLLLDMTIVDLACKYRYCWRILRFFF